MDLPMVVLLQGDSRTTNGGTTSGGTTSEGESTPPNEGELIKKIWIQKLLYARQGNLIFCPRILIYATQGNLFFLVHFGKLVRSERDRRERV